MHCLFREKVAQRITPSRIRWFHKEILTVRGPEPVSMVRKRRVDGDTIAPVVLVHGFGQNRYAWHLPERSFVNYLADQGFDVFNVDLRGHGRSRDLGAQRSGGVDDYIRGDLPAVIDAVLERSGHQRTFLMGHSLGGICAAAAGARDPESVAGVITMGPPHALGRDHAVLGGALRALGRTIGFAGILRGSRACLPVDFIGKAVHFTRFAWDTDRAPLPVRAWKPGTFSSRELVAYLERSMDGASLGTLHDLMQLATTGDLRSRIDGASYTKLIERSELPLLAMSGTVDLLANPGAVKPIYDRSHAMDKQYFEVDAGHADLLVGRQAPELVWPKVAAWLSRRASFAPRRHVASVEAVLKVG
jgi:polyhydroxyalkanoate synthase